MTKKADEPIKPFIPFYVRPPNKVIEYYYEDFDDGYGHTATLRKVLYWDAKKKKNNVATAQVIWNNA